jgi:hypothetical protein
VTQLATVAIERLDSTNVTSFLAELGSGLHLLLLGHLKGFTISDAGAMVLQKYRSTFLLNHTYLPLVT